MHMSHSTRCLSSFRSYWFTNVLYKVDGANLGDPQSQSCRNARHKRMTYTRTYRVQCGLLYSGKLHSFSWIERHHARGSRTSVPRTSTHLPYRMRNLMNPRRIQVATRSYTITRTTLALKKAWDFAHTLSNNFFGGYLHGKVPATGQNLRFPLVTSCNYLKLSQVRLFYVEINTQ